MMAYFDFVRTSKALERLVIVKAAERRDLLKSFDLTRSSATMIAADRGREL
jgi:hypothetical protein